jgi:hypothetical protein
MLSLLSLFLVYIQFILIIIILSLHNHYIIATNRKLDSILVKLEHCDKDLIYPFVGGLS